MDVKKVTHWVLDGFNLSYEPIEHTIKISETEKKYIIKYLSLDPYSENPFLDTEGMGKIIFHPKSRYICNTDDYEKALKNKFVVQLDAYIHGNITLSPHMCGIQCRFDTSHNIAIWIPDDPLIELITENNSSGETINVRTKKYAQEACTLFNQYSVGDIYGCIVEEYNKEKIHISENSCWGYFGFEYAIQELENYNNK